jgi:hypothetical protein
MQQDLALAARLRSSGPVLDGSDNEVAYPQPTATLEVNPNAPQGPRSFTKSPLKDRKYVKRKSAVRK